MFFWPWFTPSQQRGGSRSLSDFVEELERILLSLDIAASPPNPRVAHWTRYETLKALKRMEKSKQVRITHAAILGANKGMIFLGKHHADCFHQAANTGMQISRRSKDQGFMTSTGKFVSRDEAYMIANSAGQIRPRREGPLFSEEIWSDRENGMFDYDSVTGYRAKRPYEPPPT